MKRPYVLALAASLVLPAFAVAQEARAPARRLTVSPFLGYAFTTTQKGTARVTVYSPTATNSNTGAYERQVKGGVMPGLVVDYDLPGRFGASAAFAYNKRGDETVSLDFYDVSPMYTAGSTLWLVRAAATMDLLQQDTDLQIHHPDAQLFAGPVYVREVPDAVTGRPATNAFGLNAGANVDMALPWKGFSVRGTLEDYMTHASMSGVATQLGTDLSTQTSYATEAVMTHGISHMYVARVGLTYTFEF